MLPTDRLPFTAPADRPELRFPDGVRVVAWPVLALEHWDIARPMARMVISPPQGHPQQPDHPNWSWHEYGMRQGFWRMKRLFEELGITPTVTLNARVCETYPQAVEACLANGWELNAHSWDQQPMHLVKDQRATIDRTIDAIEAFSGARPRGWFGPGLTQTFDTIDHLAEAGIEYIGDWTADDVPVTLRTTGRPMVALPYNFELHDIVIMALQNQSAEEFPRRAADTLDVLGSEAGEGAKVMSIAHHPYLSGVGHRFGHVRRMWEAIVARDDVAVWDGTRLLDWYLGQTDASETEASA